MTNGEASNKILEHETHWERLLREHVCEEKDGSETIEAFEKAISALDLISHIKDRPCDACDCNKGNGCTRWECVFDKHLCRK